MLANSDTSDAVNPGPLVRLCTTHPTAARTSSVTERQVAPRAQAATPFPSRMAAVSTSVRPTGTSSSPTTSAGERSPDRVRPLATTAASTSHGDTRKVTVCRFTPAAHRVASTTPAVSTPTPARTARASRT
ncbi:hypothetical protein DEI91_05080 [Curtobacterium sp. MCBD17_032]|nr:hypothetical protein DEI91_05080 [Curtobacterium sp. MCBD17_032]